MIADRTSDQLHAALAAAEDAATPTADRIEMLVEIAMDLQRRPNTLEHLPAAIELYDRALMLASNEAHLLRARIIARRATALQALPEEGSAALDAARTGYEASIPTLRALGTQDELAEAEMNLGLVLQCLAGFGQARISDAIAAYQRALRTFDRNKFPAEFAILQNNLATAFLSMPSADEHAKMREALAVQSFEDGLKVVNLIDHPSEYAMLQNNLGNALQYASSSHPLENQMRALRAYDEVLKVRTRASAPLEYANTIANKANCLRGLPDDWTCPERGNARNLSDARDCYAEAREIFMIHGEFGKAQIIAEPLEELERELLALSPDH